MSERSLRRLGAILLACAVPAAALAQDALPRPKEFYFDDDAATTRPVQAKGGNDTERLRKLIERDGRDAPAAAAQLAAIAYREGRIALGENLYTRALSGGAQGAGRAGVLWNQGWDRYRAGDTAGALAAWRAAGTERGTAPSWMPPTLALALWSLDRRDEAVRWYAAAVRTEPQLWSDPRRHAALLPGWREDDLGRLAEVFAAWRAAPPAWP